MFSMKFNFAIQLKVLPGTTSNACYFIWKLSFVQGTVKIIESTYDSI